MHALLAGILLTASSPTLVALDLEAEQVAPAVAKLVGTQLAQRLTLAGFKVLTSADLAAVLGVERQKALLGCNEETSCFAEIGSALNAKAVVLGSVGKLGETRLLNVKVVSSGDAQPLAACSGRVNSDEGLLSEADRCADIIAAALMPARAEGPRRTWALAPLIGGSVAAITGAVLLTTANLEADAIPTSTEGPATVSRRASAASGLGTTGLVLLGAGVAVAATGAVLYLVRPGPVQPVAVLTPHGGFVGVSGVFP